MLGNLKRWGEHQPFSAEDKYGAFRTIRPKHVVVTSNYHPREIWPNETESAPIMRRFKVIYLEQPYYPEGHPEYKKEYRANALCPSDNNKAPTVVEEDAQPNE